MTDHPRGRVAGWILLALAGLAVAVALSVAASNLSTQPIGLSGEPLRAGDRLAPASVNTTTTRTRTHTTQTHTQTTTAPTTTATIPTTTSPSDADDDHGHSDGDDD
jgi:allophanate hydrolase subunit 2